MKETKKVFTHQGIALTTNHCSLVNRRVPLLLREEKVLWVDQDGRRYRKRDGIMPGTFTPPLILNLESVRRYEPDIVDQPDLEIEA